MASPAAFDLAELEHILPSKDVVLHAAAYAAPLLETLFTRLEAVRVSVNSSNVEKLEAVLLKSYELSVSVATMSFPNHVANHEDTFDRVRKLHEQLKALDVDSSDTLAELITKFGLDGCSRDWSSVLTALYEQYQANLNNHNGDEAGGGVDPPPLPEDLLVRCCRVCVFGSNATDTTSLMNALVDGGSTSRVYGVEQGVMTVTTTALDRCYRATCVKYDEEQPSSRFMSKRTLFVVCVDFAAYVDSINAGPEAEEEFVTTNVTKWTDLVFNHQPNGRIAIVGAHTESMTQDDMQTVKRHISSRVQYVCLSPADAIAQVGESWIDLARRKLEETVPNVATEMKLIYDRVLHLIHNIRRNAPVDDVVERLKKLAFTRDFVSALVTNAAAKSLDRKRPDIPRIAGLKEETSRQCLDVFSDLGLIAWASHRGDDATHTIVLDPSVISAEVLVSLVFPTDDTTSTKLDTADIYSMTKLLCSLRVHWGSIGEALSEKATREMEEDMFVTDDVAVQSGLSACVKSWLSTNPLSPLRDVPIEFVMNGSDSVHTYVTDLENTPAKNIVYSRKICAVGPSLGGKTSMLKSVVTGVSCLEERDIRTIGVDVQTYSYSAEHIVNGQTSTRTYHINCWDFAGQDVYYVAHALFFSKHTLFLLCVNLAEYLERLKPRPNESHFAKSDRLESYVREKVFPWIRLILSRQPESEVVVVGTQEDAVPREGVRQVFGDLHERLDRWADDYLLELRGLQHSDVEKAKESLKFLVQTTRDPRSFSVITAQGVDNARRTIQALVSKRSDLVYEIPGQYTTLLQAIEKKRKDAMAAEHQNERIKNRIEQLIVPATDLIGELTSLIDTTEENSQSSPYTCKDILLALHDLGEILWYKRKNDSDFPRSEDELNFSDLVILDPTIALDIVKEIVDHNFENQEGRDYDQLRRDGTMSHSLIVQRPHWRVLDSIKSADLVKYFKRLLQHFLLVYPAGTREMDSNSDLIIPTFWRRDDGTEDARQLWRQQTLLRGANIPESYVVRWQYLLSSELSKAIFDQFVVQSYTHIFSRTVRSGRVTITIASQCAVTIYRKNGNSAKMDIIMIEVVGASSAMCWDKLPYFVMAMETVLEGYPGLTVDRYVFTDTSGATEDKVLTDKMVKEWNDAYTAGYGVADLRRSKPWVPLDLSWYIEKAWLHRGKNAEIKMRHDVHDIAQRTKVIENLIKSSDKKRLLPAVWSLEYHGAHSKAQLRMFSDLTGLCYHRPIEISIPPKDLAKYGKWIRVGLSIFSIVPGGRPAKEVLDKVIDQISPSLSNVIDLAKSYHQIIDNLDLSSGVHKQDGDQRSTTLLELLRLHDTSINEFNLWTLSNLVCAAGKDGCYVWAHPHEIQSTDLHEQDTEGITKLAERAKEQVKIQLEVVAVDGLEDDKNAVCKWELMSGKGIAFGEGATPENQIRGHVSAPIDGPPFSILHDYSIVLTVERAKWGKWFSKRVGTGSLRLAPHLDFKSMNPIEETVTLQDKKNKTCGHIRLRITVALPQAAP